MFLRSKHCLFTPLNFFRIVLPESLPLFVDEGQFTYWKSVRDFFRTKGFIRIFDGFFLKTKGFLPKVYEIFWSEMPLVCRYCMHACGGGRYWSNWGESRKINQFSIIFLCRFFNSCITTNRDFRASQELVRVLDFHIGQNLKRGQRFCGPFNVLVITCLWLMIDPNIPEGTFTDPRRNICELNFVITLWGKCSSLLYLIVAVIF